MHINVVESWLHLHRRVIKQNVEFIGNIEATPVEDSCWSPLMDKLFVKSPLIISNDTPSNIRLSTMHIQTATKACIFGILAFHALKYNVLLTISTANSKLHLASLI